MIASKGRSSQAIVEVDDRDVPGGNHYRLLPMFAIEKGCVKEG